jgi:ankyrin repeat-rich membrane spanning protein
MINNCIRGAENVLQAVLITIGVALGVVMVANLYTWSRIVKSLVMSQRRKLQKSVAQLHSVRAEGYLQVRHSIELGNRRVLCFHFVVRRLS